MDIFRQNIDFADEAVVRCDVVIVKILLWIKMIYK